MPRRRFNITVVAIAFARLLTLVACRVDLEILRPAPVADSALHVPFEKHYATRTALDGNLRDIEIRYNRYILHRSIAAGMIDDAPCYVVYSNTTAYLQMILIRNLTREAQNDVFLRRYDSVDSDDIFYDFAITIQGFGSVLGELFGPSLLQDLLGFIGDLIHSSWLDEFYGQLLKDYMYTCAVPELLAPLDSVRKYDDAIRAFTVLLGVEECCHEFCGHNVEAANGGCEDALPFTKTILLSMPVTYSEQICLWTADACPDTVNER